MQFEHIDEIRYTMEQFGTIDPDPEDKLWFLTTSKGRFSFGVVHQTKSNSEMSDAGPRIFMRGLNKNNKDIQLVKTIMSVLWRYVEDKCKLTPR